MTWATSRLSAVRTTSAPARVRVRRRCRSPPPAGRPVAGSPRWAEQVDVGAAATGTGTSVSGASSSSVRKVVFTQSITGATVRKLARELHRRRRPRREALLGGQEHGDVGAAEPVDRLLGVAHHEQPARARRRRRRHALLVGVRRDRRRRCARPARSGSGRCPGTRRAAAAGSARGGGPHDRTLLGSRSTLRASTSRSWNSRRAGLAAAVGRLERVAPQGGAEPVGAAVEHAAADLVDGGRTRPRAARAPAPCCRCHDGPSARRSCRYFGGCRRAARRGGRARRSPASRSRSP